MSALLDGQTLGGIKLKELTKRGDFGLGTFELADGEMVLLDGTPYHMKHDGSTETVKPDTILPYATVTYFEPSIKSTVSDINKGQFQQHLETLTPKAGNYFLAIRVDGSFAKMKVRLVKPQDIPGESVLETVRKNQREIDMENVEGTMIGFRSPECYQGITVAGYHLHFINKNRTAGGHCLDYEIKRADTAVSVIRNFDTELPERDDFYKADLKLNQDGIIKVEGK
jgi:acetolactate decarboxylase